MAAILALAAAAFPAAAAAQDPLFGAPWRAWDAGDFPKVAPTAVAFGDIDGDGDRDAVLSRELSSGFFNGPGLSVLRGNGDGAFAPEEVYDTPVFSATTPTIRSTTSSPR